METLLTRKSCRWLLLTAMVVAPAACPGSLRAESPAEQALLARAQSLAAHGRLDMAVQTWQQVLLSDPQSREALAGIAKADMQLGKPQESEKYLERLRVLGGSSAAISQIESMPHVQPPSVRLGEARRLAQSGRYAEALRIYRDIFGDEPPAGDSALAYYDTEAAIPEDRQDAENGLRKLSQQFPADSRYAITLGRILTYDPKTRAEGIAMLQQYADTATAQDALRQANTWNEQGSQAVESTPAKSPAGNPLEAAAYNALNAGQLAEAQQRFNDLLVKEPNNPAALSGMGYVAMKQKDFTQASSYFERARDAGARGLDSAIALSHFWQQMASGGEQLKDGNSDAAIADYRGALQMKPSNPDALEALAGALMQKGSAAEAVDLFQRTLRASPDRATAWRGLFFAQSSTGDAQAALATSDSMPADLRAQLNTEPDYLRALAEDYLALGRKADSDSVIQRALALPFPDEGRNLPPERQMQYAALLMTAQRYEPALRLYRQVLTQDSGNIGAWRGLIAVEHQLGHDDEALATIGRIPQRAFDQIQNDAGFLALVGSIYQSQHEWERAQKYLERAVSVSTAPASSIELQLADVYAAQNKQQEAFTIYHREVEDHPDSLPAWRGMLGMLHQSGHDSDALRQLASMPETTRLRLEADPGYLQTLASIQVATGKIQDALATFGHLSGIYSDQNIPEPVDVQIQYGWLLLKTGDDRRLYALVSNVSNSPDIAAAQQADFNRLLAAWSVRRASAALATGDSRRAIAILEAAARAIPGNPDVRDTLAGAYLKAGEPKRAVLIYESLDMKSATLAQYKGAIGAALAASDTKHAAAWLETALDRFRDEPSILQMAAQYEQATGNSERAAAYYRAALAAMGPETPADLFSTPGNNLGDQQNGLSPTRELMDLLAPKSRSGQTGDSGSPTLQPGSANISWENAPSQSAPTLGDFAQSPTDDSTNIAADSPSQPAALPRQIDPPQVAIRSPLAGSQRISESSATRPRSRNASSCCNTFDPAPSAARPDLSIDAARGRPPDSPTASPDPQANASAAPLQPQTVARAMTTPESVPARPETTIPAPDANDANPAVQLETAARTLVNHDQTSSQPLASQPKPEANDPAPLALSQSTAQDPNLLRLDPPQQRSESLPLIQSSSQTIIPDSFAPTQPNPPPAQPLPPLTGPAQPIRQQKTPREQIVDQLAVIEGASSPWIGASSGIAYRSGQPGYDRLATYSAQAEESSMLGHSARITVITEPVLLDSGTSTGAETLRQGTLPATTIPSSESAAGIGGEVQLRTAHFAVGAGYTPHGFLVGNVIGGLTVQPPSGHFTLTLSRDPIVDTQLSYAGLRDQGSAGPTYAGNVWGGIVANGGELQIASGNALSGWYFQGGGQDIQGVHVPTNSRFDGDAGAYWRIWHDSQYGGATIGMNFFAMHYAHNLRYFTYGQGGYFSPDAYVVAALPITVNGHYQQKLHYHVTASLGLQAFNEESSPYFPLDPAVQTAQANPYYPAMTSVGGNYNFDAEGSYAIAEHWYTGGYMDFNNSRDYNSSKVGFFVRYLFRPQPLGVETRPTGIFPVQGFRPFQVP
jgi:cellulose synthase operon protein C